MKIYNSVLELIGNTPVIKADKFALNYGLKANILIKAECFNPAGSAKDRIAKEMIERAEEKGLLKEGGTVIEPTSGNTGIGLALVCAQRGYKAIFTMPDTMSVERINLLKAYGAQIILTDGNKGMKGAIEKAEQLLNETPNSFMPDQFNNGDNPAAHVKSTGKEIWEDTEGSVDIFVAGIGTGGTLSGTGKYLKDKNPKIKVVGVEPASSPLITKGYAANHGLMGMGANFIPKTLNLDICDEIIAVSEENAYEKGRNFARLEGLLVGITSGAALHAAVEIASREENHGKNIVVLLPDTGERYLSTPMFKDRGEL